MIRGHLELMKSGRLNPASTGLTVRALTLDHASDEAGCRAFFYSLHRPMRRYMGNHRSTRSVIGSVTRQRELR
jgi:hypothetical protein